MYALIFIVGAFLVFISLGGSSGAERNSKRTMEEFYKQEYTDSIIQNEIEGFALGMSHGFGGYDHWKIYLQMSKAGINRPSQYAASILTKYILEERGYRYNWEWNSWHLKEIKGLEKFLNDETRPDYWEEVKGLSLEEIKEKFPKYVDYYSNMDQGDSMVVTWELRDRPRNREIYNRWGFWPEGRQDYESRYYRLKK